MSTVTNGYQVKTKFLVLANHSLGPANLSPGMSTVTNGYQVKTKCLVLANHSLGPANLSPGYPYSKDLSKLFQQFIDNNTKNEK